MTLSVGDSDVPLTRGRTRLNHQLLPEKGMFAAHLAHHVAGRCARVQAWPHLPPAVLLTRQLNVLGSEPGDRTLSCSSGVSVYDKMERNTAGYRSLVTLGLRLCFATNDGLTREQPGEVAAFDKDRPQGEHEPHAAGNGEEQPEGLLVVVLGVRPSGQVVAQEVDHLYIHRTSTMSHASTPRERPDVAAYGLGEAHQLRGEGPQVSRLAAAEVLHFADQTHTR